MLIIMSAAFIDAELQSEFGHLPPSFLPLGNKRLYSRQVNCKRGDEKVFLTIPNTYRLDEYDKTELNRLNINVLEIHDGIALGASLLQAIILANPKTDENLNILFGDTLIDEFPQESNSIGIAEIKDDYGWAKAEEIMSVDATNQNSAGINIFAGFFSIANHRSLLESLVLANFNFINSLKVYAERNKCRFDYNNSWLDFGHVNTYYSSKVKYTTQRAFNDLVITASQVMKSSYQTFKISGEINWFKSIPPELKIYTPQFLGEFSSAGKKGYNLEYLYNTPLNELFVFSKVSDKTWKSILNSCFDFLSACRSFTITPNNNVNKLNELLCLKTKQRLDEFYKYDTNELSRIWVFNSSLECSIQAILDSIKPLIPEDTSIDIMHGDFCFSNIIYDFKTSRIKVIDPRGINIEKQPTIWGSTFYDLAKLSHSLVGMYDLILSGAYILNIESNNIEFEILAQSDKRDLQEWFFQQCESQFGLTKKQCFAMQIHLFLSMLPLHSDDTLRQKALFANVFRLYSELRKIL